MQDFIDQECEVVVLGSGEYTTLKELRRVTGYTGALVTDPSRAVFTLLAMKRNIASLLGVRPMVKALASLKQGFRPGAIQGDALQQGGAVVVRPDGSIPYLFRSQEAGDHPSIDQLLAAVTEQSVPAAGH